MKAGLSFVGLTTTLLLAFGLPALASSNLPPTPGQIWAWGPNYIGQVGDCTQTCRPEPVELSDLGEFVAADAGALFTLALKADGTVWGWGHNIYGQLGDGTNINRICPVQVAGLQDVKAIATGDCFSIALKRDGTVWAWGHNQTSQAGLCDWLTPSVTAPVQVEGVSDVIAIDAGSQHGVALKSDGSVWCWGIGLFGVLGQGDFDYHTSCVALQVPNVSGATAIAAGGHFKENRGQVYTVSVSVGNAEDLIPIFRDTLGRIGSMSYKAAGALV
jgi:alpha-tubulin suppressor-like RCC1 family protein